MRIAATYLSTEKKSQKKNMELKETVEGISQNQLVIGENSC